MKATFLALALAAGLTLSCRAGEASLPASLPELARRADLIVVATPKNTCDGCIGEGPLPNGVHPTPQYEEFFPKLKIIRLLKGTMPPGKVLLISFTVLVYGPKDPPKQVDYGKPVFNLRDARAMREVDWPGAPRKGVTYIFFLENREMREPGAHEGIGDATIVYRNFNFVDGMVSASDSTVRSVSRWATRD